MVPVRDFTDAGEMIDHYKAVRARLMDAKAVVVPPKPVFVPPPCEELVKHFKEVTASTVHTVFRPEPGPVGAKKIIAWIARNHGLNPADIYGDGRTAAVIEARFQAVAAVHLVNPGWSTPKLGRLFGGRDHTTIIHALVRMGLRQRRAA